MQNRKELNVGDELIEYSSKRVLGIRKVVRVSATSAWIERPNFEGGMYTVRVSRKSKWENGRFEEPGGGYSGLYYYHTTPERREEIKMQAQKEIAKTLLKQIDPDKMSGEELERLIAALNSLQQK